uniref:Saposin B-type domain-containing protein n=2 Tax=Bursaphelenchus xylophilus TaxID=6326 RepID=A0A1I7RN98_BURXY
MRLFAVMLIISMINTANLSEIEVCENCQKVLYITSLYYNKQRSKPFLRRKVKHLCKRYYEYRRHCLVTLVPKADLIAFTIDNALENGQYQPSDTCTLISECDKNQAPMNFSEINVDELDGSGLDLFFDLD